MKVKIDYTKPLKHLIALGKYDWVNSDIDDDNFPHLVMPAPYSETLDIELLHFDEYLETEEVEKRIAQQGYRPITLVELLALGAQYPELQRELPIIALGSVWRSRGGSRFVPCLFRGGSERSLGLYWDGFRWREYCRFGVVKVVQPSRVLQTLRTDLDTSDPSFPTEITINDKVYLLTPKV